jgi:hypothetical protein
MNNLFIRRPRLAAASLAMIAGLPVAAILMRPQATHAFTEIETPVFLDPIDLAPGEVARVRLTNLFGGDTIHAVVQIRNAEDSSLIAQLDRYVPPGQGIVQDAPFSSLLPAIQRSGHAGLIALVTLSSPAATLANTPSAIASQVAFSEQVVEQGSGRLMAVLANRRIAPTTVGQ